MLKPYNELRKVDVTPFCETRDKFLYLNWAQCIKLLHDNGAEIVYWEPIPNPKTGSSLYYCEHEFVDKNDSKNKCYETRIKVVIDDKAYIMQSPVMNGTNPVKDNSMSQQRVWNSMCRSFVKCVAIHTGLGFDLWLKEEENPLQQDDPATESEKKMIREICKKHKIDIDMLYASNGITEDTVTATQIGRFLVSFKKKYGDD